GSEVHIEVLGESPRSVGNEIEVEFGVSSSD
ncbi:hypothetical protein A2U01_0093139, partial [Trifolium medium]|nr:hypothetical protein [Trifolium medium]